MKIKITQEDKLFSEYIRKRAMQRMGGCERCHAPKTSYKELQCAHIFSRRNKATRWDEDNALGLCYGCHMYLTGEPVESIIFAKAKLGEPQFEMLRLRSMTTIKPDLPSTRIYLNSLLEGLE